MTAATDGKCQVMRGGDLSNKVSPRIIIVFEGAIGYLPERNIKEYDKAAGKNDWFRAVSLYDLNPGMLDKILYLAWRRDINISVVTWLPEDAAVAIEAELIDKQNIPVRGCFSSTPSQLARMLPYNPDVVCVYDPVPEHILTFGSKGFVLTGPQDLGKML